jgi:hypothetical protein
MAISFIMSEVLFQILYRRKKSNCVLSPKNSNGNIFFMMSPWIESVDDFSSFLKFFKGFLNWNVVENLRNLFSMSYSESNVCHHIAGGNFRVLLGNNAT